MTITEFCEQHAITLTLTPAPHSPCIPDSTMRHYRATLHKDGRRMTVPFSTGSAWTRVPTITDVIDCLFLDATEDTFTDWCGELGYDTDSRAAERIYRTIQRQTAALQTLLGADYDAGVTCERD